MSVQKPYNDEDFLNELKPQGNGNSGWTGILDFQDVPVSDIARVIGTYHGSHRDGGFETAIKTAADSLEVARAKRAGKITDKKDAEKLRARVCLALRRVGYGNGGSRQKQELPPGTKKFIVTLDQNSDKTWGVVIVRME